MIPGVIAAQRVVLPRSPAIQGSTSANTGASLLNSLAVSVPGAVQDGDVLVLVAMHNNNARTLTVSGFTGQVYNRTANNGIYVGTRVAASEPAIYTLQMDSTNTDRMVGIMVLLRLGAAPTVTAGSVARSTSGQSVLSASSITLPSAGVLFAIAASEYLNAMSISSALDAVDSVSAPYCNLAVFADAGAHPGDSGPVDMTLSVATTGSPYLLVGVSV